MPALLRPALTAFGVACLLSAASLASSGAALAQANQQAAGTGASAGSAGLRPPSSALKQIALTDKQLDGVLAAAEGHGRDHGQTAGELPRPTRR